MLNKSANKRDISDFRIYTMMGKGSEDSREFFETFMGKTRWKMVRIHCVVRANYESL